MREEETHRSNPGTEKAVSAVFKRMEKLCLTK